MKPKIAWFHCFSGIAGDMALGALIDAGADLNAIKEICGRLDLLGWDLEATHTMRNGISATKVDVICGKKTSRKGNRKAGEILKLVETADLPPWVKQKSLEAFTALAEAEGKLHQKPPAEVHFHEVGGVDAIIDIVGTMAALHNLEIEAVYSSPVAHGTGTIQCEHGTMPNPPPAVVELLKLDSDPEDNYGSSYGLDVPYELTTPTGAALLRTLVSDFTPLPEMEIIASGFGAGAREFKELPNLTQVIIGYAAPTPSAQTTQSGKGGQPAILIETNLDDITGETLADSIERLIAAGAQDAWATPIIMKKGRPAHTLSVLADVADLQTISDLIFETTGTLGIRTQVLNKYPQPRTTETIEVDGHKIRMKIRMEASGSTAKNQKSAKPEHEDLKAAAAATGKTMAEIKGLTMEKWKEMKEMERKK